MKFSPSRSALSVDIRPSRAISLVLIAVALAAIAATLYADIAASSRALAIVIELAYATYCLRLQTQQRGCLQWRESWLWRHSDGAERALQLRVATLWPGLIVLMFREADARRSLTLTLWRDSLDDDAARKLRVCLRHSPVFGDWAGE